MFVEYFVHPLLWCHMHGRHGFSNQLLLDCDQQLVLFNNTGNIITLSSLVFPWGIHGTDGFSSHETPIMQIFCSCNDVIMLRPLLGLIHLYPIILLKPLLLIWLSGSPPGVHLSSSDLNSMTGYPQCNPGVINPHPVKKGLWGPGKHENCHYLRIP